jgi:hypothetical protein
MNEISPLNSELSDFDPPHPGKGSIFPVSRGMLQTVNKTEDICEGNVIVAAGKVNFKDALKEFEAGLLNTNHLELLCCEGCIMGPGMTKGGKKYSAGGNLSAIMYRINLTGWTGNRGRII